MNKKIRPLKRQANTRIREARIDARLNEIR